MKTEAQSTAMTVRDEGIATEITTITETSSTAVAAQAEAMVKARATVALARPRDMDKVRVAMLKECRRPGFAQVARYSIPRAGKRIEGPSIKFAEAVLRIMGNIVVRDIIVYDDAAKRIIEVETVDLETNASVSTTVSLDKAVERRTLKSGETALSSRLNSTGQMVYLIAAREDDTVQKSAILKSKAMRTNILRLFPGDILEECMDQVQRTQADEDAQDPEAGRKKIVDGFFEIGVKPDHLKAYLGHPIDECSPPEMAHLRALFRAIRDGETTWAEASNIDPKTGEVKDPGSKVEGIKERLRKNTPTDPAQAPPPSDGTAKS